MPTTRKGDATTPFGSSGELGRTAMDGRIFAAGEATLAAVHKAMTANAGSAAVAAAPQGGNDAITVNAVSAGTDAVLFATMAGGGLSNALLQVGLNVGSTTAANFSRLLQNHPQFHRVVDIAIDTDAGKFFVVDADGNSINRILSGNIADLANNVTNPTLTQIFATDSRNGNSSTQSVGEIIANIEINPATGKIYWMDGDYAGEFEGGFQLWEANYDGSGARLIQTLDTENAANGFPGGVADFAIDRARGYAYVLSTDAFVGGDGNLVIGQNHVLRITLATGAVNFLGLFDTAAGGGYAAGRLNPEAGQLSAIDVDQRNGTVYFTTQAKSPTDLAGVFQFIPGATSGSTVSGTTNWIWIQPEDANHSTLQNYPTAPITGIEFDEVSGRYYLTTASDANTEDDGTPTTNEADASIFVADPNYGTPTRVQRVYEPTDNGSPMGMEIAYAAVINAGSGGSYIEQQSVAASPLANLLLTDPDGGTRLKSAAVTVGGFSAGDSLAIGSGIGLTVSVNNTTGTVTITGDATLATYQAVLRSLTFQSSSDNPTATSATRTFDVAVSDGLMTSDVGRATMSVIAVNDAPVITPGGSSLNLSEDVPASFSGGTRLFTLSDVDASASEQMTVRLSSANGIFTLASTAGLAFTLGDGTADATMEFRGTLSAINTAIGAGVTYWSNQDFFGSTSIGITASDAAGAGAMPVTIAVNVSAVADAVNDSVIAFEDQAVGIFPLGNDNFESTARYISGVSQPANGSVTINDAGTVADRTDDYIVFTPNANFYGTTNFTYTVTSGGVTETATVSVTVNSVNDAPVLAATGLNPTFSENGFPRAVFGNVVLTPGAGESGEAMQRLVMTVTGFDSTNGDRIQFPVYDSTLFSLTPGASFTFQGHVITTEDMGGGVLRVTNEGPGPNVMRQFLSSLSYVSISDAPGDTPRVFTITEVSDAGGTANDGVDTTLVNITSTVTVVPANDAPQFSFGGLTLAEDAAAQALTGFSISDVDGGPSHSVTLNAANGVLSLDGAALGNVSAVAAGGTVTVSGSVAAINAAFANGGVLYRPDADYNGTDQLSVTVSDGGLVTAGSAPVTVTAVADAVPDAFSVFANAETIRLDVLANDSFEDASRFISNRSVNFGTVTIDDNGTPGDRRDDYLTYTADPVRGSSGYDDSVFYQVTAGGVTESTSVEVSVRPISFTATSGSPIHYEGSQPTYVFGQVSLTSSQPFYTVDTMTLTVDGVQSSGADVDQLVFGGVALTLAAGMSTTFSTAEGVGVATVTAVVDGRATVSVVFGNASLASAETALLQLQFQVAGDAPAATPRVVTVTGFTFDADYDGDTLPEETFTVLADATSSVAVQPINDAPVITPGAASFSGQEDLAIALVGANGEPMFTVSDPDGAPGGVLTVSLATINGTITLTDTTGLTFTQGSNGEVTMSFTGTAAAINAAIAAGVTYRGQADYNGTDQVTVSVTDPNGVDFGGQDTGFQLFDINVAAVADGSTAVVTTSEDQAVTINPLAGSTFAPGAFISGVGQPANGTLTLDQNETLDPSDDFLVYRPNDDFFGTDTITYEVTSGGVVETVTRTVTVREVNDAPVLTGTGGGRTFVENGAPTALFTDVDVSTVEGGQSVTLVTLTLAGVQGGDRFYIDGREWTPTETGFDVVNDVLFQMVADDGSATFTISSSNGITTAEMTRLIESIAYAVPGDDIQAGMRTVSITSIRDNGGTANDGADTTNLNIASSLTVVPVNDTPVIVSMTRTNTNYVENGAAATQFSDVVLSTVESGQGFTGATITLSGFEGANDVLVFAGNDLRMVNGATVTIGTVVATVSISGGLATVTLSTPAISAVAFASVIEGLTYRYDGDAPSAAQRTLLLNTLTDNGGGASTNATSLGTSFFIVPENDAPVNTLPTGLTAPEDSPVSTVFAGFSIADVDQDPAGIMSVTIEATVGVFELRAPIEAGMTFASRSNGGFTLTGTLSQLNSVLAGGIGYTTSNAPEFNGTATLTMTTTDSNGGTTVSTTPITVTPVQDAFNDVATVAEGGSVTVDVLGNDTFFSNPNLVLTATNGAHGTVTIDTRGTAATDDDRVIYTATGDYNGTDAFTYSVTSNGITETASVTVTISPVQDAFDDTAQVNEDQSAKVFVLENDTFAPGATISAWTQGANGTVTLLSGTLVYAGNGDFHGTDTFTYTVTSGGVTETATVSVDVLSVNDAPTGANRSVSLLEDTARIFTVADFGFSDAIDGDAMRGVVFATVPANGAIVVTSGGVRRVIAAGEEVSAAALRAGEVVFEPAGDFDGRTAFTFQVVDNGGTANNGSNIDATPRTFTITMRPDGDAPVAVDDAAATTEDQMVRIAVLDNDTDVDGGPKWVVRVEGQELRASGDQALLRSGAIVTLAADGSLTYDANGAFDYLVGRETADRTGASSGEAEDRFRYQLVGGSQAFVTVTVAGVDSPGGQVDEVRGTDGNDSLSYIGGDAAYRGGNGYDRLFVGRNAPLTAMAGQVSGIERMIVADGGYADLSALTKGLTIRSGSRGMVRQEQLSGEVLEHTTIIGTARADKILGGLGEDSLSGGGGDDRIFVSATPGFVDGGAGKDHLLIRDGDRIVSFDDGSIVSIERIHVLDGASLDLSAVTESVAPIRLRSAEGSGAGVVGTQARDHIFGGAGNDRIEAGDGNDVINGGGGGDQMWGDDGRDRFVFAEVSDFGTVSLDRVMDFEHGQDVIDLSAIDTAPDAWGDQGFAFIGADAFSGTASELRVVDQGPELYLVEGDVDADGIADFSFTIVSPGMIDAADFRL